MIGLGKKLCKVCEHRRLELAEDRLIESWLCLFDADVFCGYSQVPEEKRVRSKCLSCEHYARFEREMEEEDDREAEFFEAVCRDPDAYLRGEI